MKILYTIVFFLALSCAAFGQFQLNIPNLEITGITRFEDTIFLWGEDDIWKSTDKGKTIQKLTSFSTTSSQSFAYTNFNHGYFNACNSYPILKNNDFFRISRENYTGNFNSTSNYESNFNAHLQQIFSIGNCTQLTCAKFYSAEGNLGVQTYFDTLQKITFGFVGALGGQSFSLYDQSLKNFNFKSYLNQKIIGFSDTLMCIIDTDSQSFQTYPIPTTFQMDSATYFKNLSPTVLGVFTSPSTYTLFNSNDLSFSTKTIPIYPYNGIHEFKNEVLYRKDDLYYYYDLITGDFSNTSLSLPDSSEIYHFLGKKYILKADKFNFKLQISEDLGLTWQMASFQGIISNRPRSIMDYGDTLYATKQNKLYKTPKSRPTDTMAFHSFLPSSEIFNFDSIWFSGRWKSIDQGKSWVPFGVGQKYFYTDYENKIIYYATTDSSSNTLFRTKNLGTSWDTIPIPNIFQNDLLSGFLAFGDTLLYSTIISKNGGQSWDLLNLDSLPANDNPQHPSWKNNYRHAYINRDGFWVGKSSFDPAPPITSPRGVLKFDFNSNLHIYDTNIRGDKFVNLKNNMLWATNSNYGYPSFSINKLHNFSTKSILGYGSILPNSLNACYDDKSKKGQIAVGDNYVLDEFWVYPLVKYQLTFETCDSIEHNGISYMPGFHVLPGGDTSIEVRQLPFSTRFEEVTLCYGDTIFINNKMAIGSGAFHTIVDTISNSEPSCGEIVTYGIYSKFEHKSLSTQYFCEGDTISINGQAIWQETTVYDTVPGIRPACDTIFSTIYRPGYYRKTNPNEYFCHGDTVYYNGMAIFENAYVYDTIPGTYPTCDTIFTTIFKQRSAMENKISYHCNGQRVVLYDTVYTESSNYLTYGGTDVYGCDSIINHYLYFSDPIYTFNEGDIHICEGDSVAYLGTYYKNTVTIDTAYVPTGPGSGTACFQYILNIIVDSSTYDTLPSQTFCQGETISVNNQLYDSTATLIVPKPNTHCVFSVLNLNMLPVSEENLDTTASSFLDLNGIIFTQDTNFTKTTLYQNHPCDSLIQHINIHIQTTATSEKEDNFGIQLYPNPAQNKIQVNWKTGEVKLSLFDIKGRILLKKTGFSGLELDLSSFSDGVYFLKIDMGNKGSAYRKIVVQR